MEFPQGPFSIILSDPPWHFPRWGKKSDGHRGPDYYYPTMTLKAIKALPVESIAAKDAVLLLWATMPLLLEALDVMAAWGFDFRTVAFTLVKHNADGSPFMGLGYYTRANAEFCLLGRRGKGLPVINHDVPSLIQTQRREHSRKPDAHPMIERLFGKQPSLEMFARRHYPADNWTCWGNQLPDEVQAPLLT